ncbi:hypothetical protein BOX15_Mlig001738g6 [Macrostomum lignano]|uniref:Uncharacterized protein n=2 Tax=Macrostomum lignano TaxID=282301 RepID=A0A267G0N5_9PLAT|nr:hypothetical protein BOX15_Mlig001738g6 [Macrostomum lignano]
MPRRKFTKPRQLKRPKPDQQPENEDEEQKYSTKSRQRTKAAKKSASIVCRHCNKAFKTRRYAVLHEASCQMANSSGAASFQAVKCDECGGSYANHISYNSHLSYCKGVRNNPQHPCQLCSQAFARLHDLKRHMELTHNGIKRFVCDLCYRPFGRANHLRRHVETLHRDGKLHLSKKKSGQKERELDNPPAEQAALLNDLKLACPFSDCGDIMEDAEQLRVHLASHCGSSDEVLDLGSAEQAELRIVELDSKPALQQKQKKQKKPSKRRLDDPFMCPLNRICCQSFNRFSHLMRHLSSTHKHVFLGGRNLLQRCTTLRINSNGEGEGTGLLPDRCAQLRRSAMPTD